MKITSPAMLLLCVWQANFLKYMFCDNVPSKLQNYMKNLYFKLISIESFLLLGSFPGRYLS